MKRIMRILLVAGLTAGVLNCAEAQRSRNSGGSSRGESRGSNVSAQRGGGGRSSVSQVRPDRGNAGNRYNSPVNSQRVDRQVVANRESSFRNAQPRNEVRDNRVGVTLEITAVPLITTGIIAAITELVITVVFLLHMVHATVLFQEAVFQFILAEILIIFIMDFIMDTMVGTITLYFHPLAFV
jgi:hypothetical protein